MELNQECAKYLRSKKIDRIMNGIRKKYESLGTVGGNYVLTNPSDSDKDFLRGLFKKDFSKNKSISISLMKFENAFSNTRFEGVSLVEVLVFYFDQEMITSKESLKLWQDSFEDYFRKIRSELKTKNLITWLDYVLSHKTSGGYKWILKLYKNEADLEKLFNYLDNLIDLTESSEDEIILTLAAAKITKDPHALDRDKELYKGFMYYLSFIHEVEYPKSLEDHDLLLNLGNVLTNSLNRVVRTYGLNGKYEGSRAQWWMETYYNHEPLLLTDMNLKRIDSIYPCWGKEVYCFENPSVFHEIVVRGVEAAAICTYGQINMTAHKLLRLLEKSGVKVYYHGDFDPEGLLIADRLLKRYKNVDLLMYNKESYNQALSNEVISERRLKQLDNLKDSRLMEMAKWIRASKQSAFEEYLIDEIINWIEGLSLKRLNSSLMPKYRNK